VLNGQHSKHFSLEAWHTLGREEYPGLKWTTLNREGPMSYIFAILAVPFLSATGITIRRSCVMAGVLPSPAALKRFTVRHPRHLLIVGTARDSIGTGQALPLCRFARAS
jgi:hypothetical protein